MWGCFSAKNFNNKDNCQLFILRCDKDILKMIAYKEMYRKCESQVI